MDVCISITSLYDRLIKGKFSCILSILILPFLVIILLIIALTTFLVHLTAVISRALILSLVCWLHIEFWCI